MILPPPARIPHLCTACIPLAFLLYRITGRRIVVAVGGRPSRLSIPGGEHAIDSDDLFSMERAPGKTLMVGAAYIALECAGFLTALGFDVTIMVRSILLRGFDRECSEAIGEYMKEGGTNFIYGKTPQSIEKLEDGRFKVTWEGGDDIFDTVFAAIGECLCPCTLCVLCVCVPLYHGGPCQLMLPLRC